ncbi:MAG: hypothetical protein R3D84_12885 [Paracoccaceae bacterium]
MARKTWKFPLILTQIFVGTAASAAVAPAPLAQNTDHAWQNLRREFESDVAIETTIVQLEAVLKSLPSGVDAEQIVRGSYAATRVEDHPALDSFWMATITRRGDAALFEAFLQNRVASSAVSPMTRDQYLEQWLVQANGDCYSNCGGGGGGDDDHHGGGGKGHDKGHGGGKGHDKGKGHGKGHDKGKGGGKGHGKGGGKRA